MSCKFELEHVGIHGESKEGSEELAKLLCGMFNLEPRNAPKSCFAGNSLECMQEHFLGTYGHIALRTPDLAAAVEELKGKGLSFNMDTAAYNAEGQLINIYLAGEFGGFAFHIMQK